MKYALIEDGQLSGYSHVLLFRHGRATSEPGLAESDRPLSKAGVRAVQQVARRLAEEVSAGRREFKIAAVLRGTYRQVEETADLIVEALKAQDPTAWPEDVRAAHALNPDTFWAQRGDPDVSGISIQRAGAHSAQGKALLIIGHEPQLSAIARQLLAFGAGVVTPSAGVSCIELSDQQPWHRARLRWVIEPQDEKTTELLRAKIASKMDVAKVFGAVITFALSITLNGLMDAKQVASMPRPNAVSVAAALLALALVLYIAVLYAYDSLLMPTRFWGTSTKTRRGRRVVARPPSSQNLVMQQNMVWLWSRPFTLANILVTAAFGLLAWGGIGIPAGWVIAIVGLAAGAAYWTRSIDLGVQD